jgi:hypothetical protein
MLRFLFRLVILGFLLAVGAGAAAYYLRAQPAEAGAARTAADRIGAATETLVDSIDRERIRDAGAEIAGTIGQNVGEAGAALTDARLTAKIKSKIALDDTLAGSRINIDTESAKVTVRGTARSAAQRDRALQLARETAGVTEVVDQLRVEGR